MSVFSQRSVVSALRGVRRSNGWRRMNRVSRSTRATSVQASQVLPEQAQATSEDFHQDLNSTLRNATRGNDSTPPADAEDVKGQSWADYDVAKWRSAVFTTQSYFQQLYMDTTDFVADLCKESGKDVLLIELGCGTGEAIIPLFPHAKYKIGIDFNDKFVGFCDEQLETADREHVRFITGDAGQLDKILADEAQVPKAWVEDTVKVVICVGNTIGIMPNEVREQVYEQMKAVAGTDGSFCIVYWNGNTFGDACQNFYHKNPQLCGEFSGDSIDLDTCTLTTPSGYVTHWTTPEEARLMFEGPIDAEVLQLEERGNGVLVAGRA